MMAAGRSWVTRQSGQRNSGAAFPPARRTLCWLNSRMFRFRYLGDYLHAFRKGWLDLLADSSALYAELRSRHGLPCLFAPWGGTSRWYEDLNLERDIDVLWMGKLATRRRQRMLERVLAELRASGIRIHNVDGVENPFVFGEDRTHLLNRAKITLNITRTWYDDNFSRLSMAASNRSLVVSEPLLPHCPPCKPGMHYVSASAENLGQTILHYLRHEEQRLSIVETAYQLFTTELRMQNSVKIIMDEAVRIRQLARDHATRMQNRRRTYPAAADNLSLELP
jgi:hypothetical protein